MARRGFGGMTALRAALGAAVGVGEGLQQREILAAQRKKDEEAAALTRFNALQAAGFGFTPRRRPADLGAPGAGEMAPSAAPATATPIGSALSSATAGATPAPSTGTPMGAALGAAETRQPSLTPMGMLQEPVRVGGMEFDLIDPQEVARQRQAQQLSLYEQQRAVDARTAEQKRAAERAEKEADIKRTARLVQSTFRDRNGKPLSEDAAMFVAESGKTPIELGLVERPMTEAERQSMAARWSELALSRKRFAADQAQREAGGTAAVPIPSNERRSMTELEASVAELDKALRTVQSNPNAFGLKTVMPNVVLSRTEGVKPRADVTAAIVKLRRTEFGTAMSKQERESGESLFPAGGDSAETVQAKLSALREKAQLELDSKRSFYGISGGQRPAQAGGGRSPSVRDY